MVAAVEMEKWRSYFGKAGADIWTVIQQAINIAAIDFPMDFRERRSEIAETLFARNLAMIHARVLNHDSKLITREECEVQDSDGWARSMEAHDGPSIHATHSKSYAMHADDDGDADDDADDEDAAAAHRNLHSHHQAAEPNPDELEKDTCLIRDINGIKAIITNGDQPENVVVEALQRLQFVQITVEALKETEIGKQVKVLKKHPSQRVRALVKELVRDWKVIVDEWANNATDGTTAARTVVMVETDYVDRRIQEPTLPSPQFEEAIEDGAPSVDVSKLFSFMDGEICTEDKVSRRHSTSVEPSVKDNLHYLSRSQSGSMLTDSSDFDAKASTNHPWGHRTPEERGSATRDVYPPSGNFGNGLTLKGQTSQRDKARRDVDNGRDLQPSKGTVNPGRQSSEMLKVKPTSGGKQLNSRDVGNRTHIVQKPAAMYTSGADKSSLLKCDKSQVDQKLEIAKRKLHQGYQQAENAKKQRIIQVLDFPEGVKAGQPVKGKANPLVQNKGYPPTQNRTGSQSSYGGQRGRVT